MINRKIKPEPSGEIKFSLPQINIFNLNNSIKVYHIQKKTLPIVQINILVPAGSILDSENKLGTAILTAMLVDEGAGNLTGLEISDRIESLGTILDINTNKEYSTFSILSLKENLNDSLNILSLILKEPTFAEDDFERELQKLKSKVIQLNNEPSYLASKYFNKVLYANTPYQLASHGTQETHEQIDNSSVIDFYNNNFPTDKIKIIVVGDLDKNETMQSCNAYFGDWNLKPHNSDFNIQPSKTNKKILLINKDDAEQSEIRMGFLSKGRKSEDFYARTILNSIIGGQFSSRLNLNLREDKGYTYGVHSNYNYNKLGSSFNISTSVKAEKTLDSIKEIFSELEKVITTIKEDEVKFSKSYLVRSYPSFFETYSQLARNLSLLPIFNLNKDYFINYTNKINSTSFSEVKEAAINNVLLDQLVTVVVGNKNIIEESIRNFAEVTNSDFLLID